MNTDNLPVGRKAKSVSELSDPNPWLVDFRRPGLLYLGP